MTDSYGLHSGYTTVFYFKVVAYRGFTGLHGCFVGFSIGNFSLSNGLIRFYIVLQSARSCLKSKHIIYE